MNRLLFYVFVIILFLGLGCDKKEIPNFKKGDIVWIQGSDYFSSFIDGDFGDIFCYSLERGEVIRMNDDEYYDALPIVLSDSIIVFESERHSTLGNGDLTGQSSIYYINNAHNKNNNISELFSGFRFYKNTFANPVYIGTNTFAFSNWNLSEGTTVLKYELNSNKFDTILTTEQSIFSIQYNDIDSLFIVSFMKRFDMMHIVIKDKIIDTLVTKNTEKLCWVDTEFNYYYIQPNQIRISERTNQTIQKVLYRTDNKIHNLRFYSSNIFYYTSKSDDKYYVYQVNLAESKEELIFQNDENFVNMFIVK